METCFKSNVRAAEKIDSIEIAIKFTSITTISYAHFYLTWINVTAYHTAEKTRHQQVSVTYVANTKK